MSINIFGGNAPHVRIFFEGHAGQNEVTQALTENFKGPSPASIIELICSRAWGKTLFLCCQVLAPYLDAYPNAKVMWVAPTYLIGMAPIDDVFRGTNEDTGERYVPEYDEDGNRVWEFAVTKSGPLLRWWNGATVTIRSADAPDSIVSKGYNLIIIDEAALIDEKVFTLQILGTARKAGIKIFAITTPRGKKHWTYKFFLKGQDTKETQYLSFQQPYTKNPHFSSTLKELIRDIPEWLFRQEYMAEFIEDGDSVFRGIDSILEGAEINFPSQQQEWEKPITDITFDTIEGAVTRRAHERAFVTGMDLAKSVDYTVITTMDCETGDLVYYRRLNKTDYREVLNIASQVCQKYNHSDLIFDATGVGSGLADMLNNYDVNAHPFVFTNESKNDIVNKLILSVEYKEITLPNITTIKNELAAYTYTLTRTGKVSYNAPAGFHDDAVMSLAMANFYRKDRAGGAEVTIIEDIISHNSRSYDGPKSLFDMDDDD